MGAVPSVYAGLKDKLSLTSSAVESDTCFYLFFCKVASEGLSSLQTARCCHQVEKANPRKLHMSQAGAQQSRITFLHGKVITLGLQHHTGCCDSEHNRPANSWIFNLFFYFDLLKAELSRSPDKTSLENVFQIQEGLSCQAQGE